MTDKDILEILQEYLASKQDNQRAGYTGISRSCPIAQALQWKTGENWIIGNLYAYHGDDGRIGLDTTLQDFVLLVDNIGTKRGALYIRIGTAKKLLEKAMKKD